MKTVSSVPNNLDQAFSPQVSRYVVGIDLGTTNCAVAFVDTSQELRAVEIFRIEQMVDANTREMSDTLPSFHYELMPNEISGVDARFLASGQSHQSVVGIMARQRGMEQAGRAIASAKSWLCHKMVDRESDLLPWGGDEDVARVSPVEVSRRYLEHICKCWDRAHPNEPLKNQDTVVTLPASFDEIARRLTIEAAKQAGIEKLHLIEEPQAAFYAWLQRHSSDWMEHLRAGQTILVCDIGGGTTDFTLIRVTQSQVDTENFDQTKSFDASRVVESELRSVYGLHRVAVGEHLMLGGDNLDIALAKAIEQKLCHDMGQTKLKPRQWDALKSQCRSAKERFLSDQPPQEITLAIPSGGSKLIEGLRTVSVSQDWAHKLLIEGFFGLVPLDSRPLPQDEGFQEFGLPYATEPNILKHLAAFLWDHRRAGRESTDLLNSKTDSSNSLIYDPKELKLARPDWILFNGGVLESPQVRNAIIDQICNWFGSIEPGWRPGVLKGNRLDLAVAQGAAYYGIVSRGEGVKIDATLARTYYLQVSQSPPLALCIMPAKAHPGEHFTIDQHVFELTIGEPVRFQLFSSHTKLTHVPGDIVEIDDVRMTRMPSLQSVLNLPHRKERSQIPVKVEAQLTEIGTLQTHLVAVSQEKSPDHMVRWQLEFEARGATQSSQSSGSAVDELQLQRAADAIRDFCSPDSKILPKDMIGLLAERLGQKKQDWEPAVLRQIWKSLLEQNDYRKRSAGHEARWMNLVGWCLRPGFGYPGDDWRVNETWRSVHNKLIHRSAENVSETIVLWRRISGGFTAGQQRALFQDIWPRVRGALGGGSGVGLNANITTEFLRLIGSLEWLDVPDKITVAKQLLDNLGKKRNAGILGAMLWTLGRLGTRVPAYGNLQKIVPASQVHPWIKQLLALDELIMKPVLQHASLCFVLWARPTGDRYRDIDESLRADVLAWMERWQVSRDHMEVVKTGRDLTQDDTNAVFGEALPLGFTISRRGV